MTTPNTITAAEARENAPIQALFLQALREVAPYGPGVTREQAAEMDAAAEEAAWRDRLLAGRTLFGSPIPVDGNVLPPPEERAPDILSASEVLW